ncbi:MAG: sulfatase-like hydrolase/transferase [Phycisphaera sp.]|nr:sulfatase-like hydrolase/transferase [Phycisphaera sp.]
MKRSTRHLWTTILVTSSLAPATMAGPTDAGDSRPSIVLLLADDAGWQDFGFQGSAEFDTPALDRLASEGIVLDACYVTASVCSPSRAGLLTGRQQQRFGHEYNLPGTAPRAEGGLPLGERTIADRLRDAGYATGIVGKWHLGLDDAFLPTARGFDEFRGLRAGSRSYFGDERLEGSDRAWERIDQDSHDEVVESDVAYVTDLVATESVDFVERHADHPFLLIASFTAPHTPMHALPGDLAAVSTDLRPERRRVCAAMTIALDRACERIVEAVDATGRESIVIFLGDNGGATNNGSDNGPLRGMKGSHFEGGVRVPAVWRATGGRSGRIPHPLSVLDLDATLLAMARADVAGIDGIDIRPWLEADRRDRPRQVLQWRRGPVATIRDRDLKAIRVDGRHTLLFDLATDPSEIDDLSSDHPGEVVRLLASLAAWEHGLHEPLWTTGPRWRDNLLRKHDQSVTGRDAERRLP